MEMDLNSNVSFSAANKDFLAGRYTQSLETLNQLLDIQKDAKTYALLARTLLKLGFKRNAAVAYELAGKYEGPHGPEYMREATKLYHESGDDDMALHLGLRTLLQAPKDADIIYVLSQIYLKRGNIEVIKPFVPILLESDNPLHHQLVASFLSSNWRDKTNHPIARNLLKRFPNNFLFRAFLLSYAREFCYFDLIDKHHPPVDEAIRNGNLDFLKQEPPFYNLHWCGDERLNQKAVGVTSAMPESASEQRRNLPHSWSDKIRIGYVSSDFWDSHATMKLLQSILELHDPSRFEVTLFCYSSRKNLELNRADRRRWGKVIQILDIPDAEVAEVIRQRNIDILVDLKGHTTGSRSHIFNSPLAPIHVAWLGFPGSTVNVDLDYIIGDPVVLPESSKPFYHEKFCRLPESYQPNDPYRRPLPQPISRAELGLPEDEFVFASFNNNRKITAETIDIWFRILKRTKQSILWILIFEAETQANILARAKAAGISSKRIVFISPAGYSRHLNRLPAADLALDTFPVNGHTTTSEQLWAGLPVLTVKGTNFASRVSESLLNAIGVPELVAPDIKAYEDMAVDLYENRDTLSGYRQRLIDNRFVKPLFDAERFTRHLETAYEMMVERAKAGLAPDHFDVPAQAARTAPFHGYTQAAE